MRRVGLAGGIALALVGGLISAAPTASATLTSGWSPAYGHQFTTNGTSRSLPNDVIDGAGDSTMAYFEATATGAIMAASLPASATGTDWADVTPSYTTISDTSSNNYIVDQYQQPQLVVDGYGTVTAAWLQQDSSRYFTVWVSSKPLGGNWSPAQSISVAQQGADASDLHLAVAGDQTVTAAWLLKDPTAGTTQVYSAMDVAGKWSLATELSDPTTETNGVGGVQIAGDRAGNFVALWVDFPTDPTAQVMGKTFTAGGSWTVAPAAASPGSGVPSNISVAADGVGTFAALWLRSNGSFPTVEATDLALDTTTWASASHTFISHSGAIAASPQIADDGYGDAVAIWIEGPFSSKAVYTARRDTTVNSTWTEEAGARSGTSSTVSDPQISIDWLGNAVAAWTQGSNLQVWASVRSWKGSWSGAPALSNASAVAGNYTLASGGMGNYSVFWQQTPSTTSEIYEASYDNAPPYVWTPKPTALFVKGNRVRVAWKGYDWSGIKNYTVIQEVAPWNGRFPSQWSYWKQNVTATSAGHALKPGKTYCFRAGATDNLGHQPFYGFNFALNCVTTPVDDVTASVSAGWGRFTATGYYRGTYSVTAQRGASMTLKGVHAKRLALLVAKGPGNGRIKVLWNGLILGRYSLGASANHKKVVIPVKLFQGVKKGTLKIVVISSGKPVRIDGIYASKL